MKKMIALFLTLIMLVSSGAAYAGKAKGQPEAIKKTVEESVYDDNADRKQGNDSKGEGQQKRVEMQQRKKEITRNRQQLNELKAEVKVKTKAIQQELRRLQNNPSELTEEKAAQIREKMTLVRAYKNQLKETNGKIESEAKQLRLKKQNKNSGDAIGNYNNICEVQEQRIKTLTKISADLTDMLNALKA